MNSPFQNLIQNPAIHVLLVLFAVFWLWGPKYLIVPSSEIGVWRVNILTGQVDACAVRDRNSYGCVLKVDKYKLLVKYLLLFQKTLK